VVARHAAGESLRKKDEEKNSDEPVERVGRGACGESAGRARSVEFLRPPPTA